MKKTNELLNRLNRLDRIREVLPSENRLAEELAVSRSTVHNILMQLRTTGIVEKEGRRLVLARRPRKRDFIPTELIGEELSERLERGILKWLTHPATRPGTAFTETQLARQFGTTPIPVRETLNRISQTGLIQKQPRCSWTTVLLTEKMVHDLFEVRESLECQAIQKWLNGTRPKDRRNRLAPLLDEHHRVRRNKAFTVSRIVTLDRKFHHFLFSALDNQYYQSLLEKLDLLIRYQQRANLSRFPRSKQTTVADHIEILQDLMEGKGKQAQRTMRNHLAQSRDILLRMVQPASNGDSA